MTFDNTAEIFLPLAAESGNEIAPISTTTFAEETGVRRCAARATLRPTSRGKIVGDDISIRQIMTTLDRVAPSSCTVLVTGESGTGKELFIAAVHDASPRRDAALVCVNCGAIPENLVESELFGHAKGAFTGAQNARRGLVAAAEGGTLFLDEVGELPLSVQVKLLRLLQTREYTPVGDTRVYKADVRIVAATNRDLEVEVVEKRFREDLYFRLNVIHVQLPSLRERSNDIPMLARHFLKSSAERIGRTDLHAFSADAMAALKSDKWVGNIRALENTVERAVLLAAGPEIELSDLAPRFRQHAALADGAAAPALPTEGMDLFAAVEDFENGLIRQALARTGGNKNRAAQLLKLNRTTLVEMLKRKKIA